MEGAPNPRRRQVPASIIELGFLEPGENLVAAAFIPARRAAGADPAESLRAE